MFIGIDVDAVLPPRLKHPLDLAPAIRNLHFIPTERELNVRSLAARFAAEEAVARALGAPVWTGSTVRWTSTPLGRRMWWPSARWPTLRASRADTCL